MYLQYSLFTNRSLAIALDSYQITNKKAKSFFVTRNGQDGLACKKWPKNSIESKNNLIDVDGLS